MAVQVQSMFPPVSMENAMKLREWRDFYSDFMRGGNSLDKVCEIVNKVITQESRADILGYQVDLGSKVNPAEILSSFLEFYTRHCRRIDITDKTELKKHEWNTCKDILRYLQYKKENKPTFLLSERERTLGEQFTDSLASPPAGYILPEIRHPFIEY